MEVKSSQNGSKMMRELLITVPKAPISLSLSLEFLNTEQKALLKNATGFKLPKSSEATNCHFKVCPHSGLLYLVQS